MAKRQGQNTETSTATIGFEAKLRLSPALTQREREEDGAVVLLGRLRKAIRRLAPAIPEEAWATIRQIRRVQIVRTMNP